MTLAATTISDIVLNADEADLDRIIQTVKDRRKVLTTARAASVQVGVKASLTGISPKYLVGLTGTVVLDPHGRRGQRAFALKLDESSTNRLRGMSGRFYILPDEKEHVLGGIPMACFKVLD